MITAVLISLACLATVIGLAGADYAARPLADDDPDWDGLS